MSLYHIVFVFLLFGVLIEYNKRETPRWLFRVSFLILVFMMAFRFGQGSDYYSYNSIYNTMPLTFAEIAKYKFMKCEIGWRILCAIFKALGISFVGFVAILSVFEMFMLWRFLSYYCKNQMLALFLGYHTLYLTYFYSAFRQAFVISLFLGLFLEWLLQGKIIRYCIGVLLCATMHSVAWFLLLPIVFYWIKLSFTHTVCLVAIGFSLGIILSIFNVGAYLQESEAINTAESYLGETSISVIALVERVVTYIFVTYTVFLHMEGREPEQKDKLFKLFKIYSLSLILYGILMWSPLISSRAIYLFKIMEIPLLSVCISKTKKARTLITLYCVLLSSLLYYKNIGSYISQGKYTEHTIVNYPYVTIFEAEKMAVYRKDTGYYIDWLDFEFDNEFMRELKEIYEAEVEKEQVEQAPDA